MRRIASASSPCSPITTRRPPSFLPGLPWPVELMLDARADTLNEKTHRLALHLGKAFDAQNIMLSRRLRYFRKEFLRRAKRRHIDDESSVKSARTDTEARAEESRAAAST